MVALITPSVNLRRGNWKISRKRKVFSRHSGKRSASRISHMIKGGFAYIMANIRQTLYVGVTSDLTKRVYQHKNNLVKGFTEKYNLHMLVYYEVFDTIEQAIIREKQIKDMDRKDKLTMIYKFNPEFKDLSDQIAA